MSCPHGEEHAEWYYRSADHDEGTVRIEYDCGICHEAVLARLEPLSDAERDCNDRAEAYQQHFASLGYEGVEIASRTAAMLRRVAGTVRS